MGTGALLLKVLVVFAIAALSTAQPPPKFTCGSTSKCRALVDYRPQNATTIDAVEKLFEMKHLLTFLGANNLPNDTKENFTLPASRSIKIPIHCKCDNGTGLSDGHPVYKVRSGDLLSTIAEIVFSRLVTFQQIADANRIPNPDQITVGQELWIPLPCSCDEVDGSKVVHYAHLVDKGSSIPAIAEMYGVPEETILKLNGIADPKDLEADQVLDIPLKACSSVIRNDSLDYPFLISNGTYDYTANNCVKCKCEAANNFVLQCNPSQLKPSNSKSSDWSSCPAMRCDDGRLLGDSTSSGCDINTCAYAGYSRQKTTFTNISTLSTCAPPNAGRDNGNSAPKMGSGGLGWTYLFTCMHLLGFGLLLSWQQL